MPFRKAWDWQAAYCCSACGDTLSAGRGHPCPLLPAPSAPEPPPLPPQSRSAPGAWRPPHPPPAAAPASPWPSWRLRGLARLFRRDRHGGAGGALLPAAGRVVPVPVLLPARRQRLRDRCAGGVGWGPRRPPVAGLPVPAGGARREAQVRAAARGARPRLRVPLSPDRPRREALGRGAASLSPGDGPGTLRLQGDAPCSGLELCPLPAGEARSQLRALVFGMAGRIESLERRLSVVETLASSCSPEKNTAQNQQQFLPDPKPWKNRGAGSALPARRKIPGESLINPGFKSKKAPSGVDFEDS